jgi:hypothetical protein
MGGGGGILSPITQAVFGKPQTVDTPNYSQAAQDTAAGNLANAQATTAANRVNQSTPYGSLNYTQTTDANGNPTWSATQSLAPQFQGTFNSLAANAQNTAATPFGYSGQALPGQNVNTNLPISNVSTQINQGALPSYGINPGQTYSDAIMSRLQPSLTRQSSASDVQLANQGIMPGSEAYRTAKTLLSQGQNDALTSAIVGGMDVGLRANNQAYGQQLGQINANLAGNQQFYNQNLGQAGLNLQGQNQAFNQALQGNQQGYNQALSTYNNPINQLGAFQSATQPGFVNPYNQQMTGGPDYTSSMMAANQSNQANANAQNAQNNAMMGGLFSLGGALGGAAIKKYG